MKVTLNKANRILSKLNYQIKLSSLSRTYPASHLSFPISEKPENILLRLEEEKKNFEKKFLETKSLIEDTLNLKSFIFETNAKIGLNPVLNEIDKTNKLLNMYQTTFEQLDNREFKSSILLEEIQEIRDSHKEVEGCHSFNLGVKFVDENLIKGSIQALKKTLSILEDQKTVLNATEIEISLSQETLDFLGI